MQEVVSSDVDDAREFLLVDIIETYCRLSEEDAERYQRLISRKEYQRVLDTELTWADKLILKGKREALLRQVEQKFGPLPLEVTDRIAAEESAAVIDGWLERILTARTLGDLELNG